MTTYHTLITNNGKAQIANAINTNTKVAITHLAVGDGRGATPAPNATATRLTAEKARVAVNHVGRHATTANWIEVHAIIPSSTGGFTVREFGLYAGTTLIAVGSFPATYKPSATEGGAREMSIKLIIAVENASVVNVTLDDSLVYATRKWVEDNFVNHDEVIDNLTSTETTKPLSAHQGKILNDKITATDAKADTKANQSTTIIAGNGLTGGGDLSTHRTLSLGTPSKITANSTNVAVSNTHSHEIDKASTTIQGIVQLNDTLTSTATNQALTANQGKILDEKITAVNATANTKANQSTTITAGNGLTGGGNMTANRTVALGTPSQITASTTNSVTATSHTHAIDKASTSVAGVVQLNDTLASTATNQALTANQGKALNDNKLDKTGGVLTGTLYAANSGIKAASDNDTGIEWLRDGVVRMIADGRERLIIEHGGTTLKTQDGIKLSLQNDKNLVLYDEQNRPVFSSNAVLSDLAGKVNKAGDTMTGHLAVTYNSDWVGMAVKNPNNQKNGFYDVNIGGVTRGSFQIAHAGNNAYNAIINITPQGDNAEGRIAGLTVSATGLHSHTYGHLHEYFVKTRDDQTIDGNKTFSQEVVTTQANGFRIKNSAKNRSIFWRFDGDVLYLLKTPNGDPNGNWDDARPLEWNVNTNQLVVRGNADTTTRLQTARNIAMTGDGSWNVNFDGSGNAIGVMTLSNSGVTAGSYNSVTVDAKGRVTRGLTQTHGLVTATSATGTTNTATTNTNTFLNIVASGVGQTASVGSSTQITGTNGISVSSDTAGKLIVTRDSNSPTATKLQTARTISLTGAVTGNVNFDGSGNVSLTTTQQGFTQDFAESGYSKLPNGLIVQWGKTPLIPDEGNADIRFPIAFPRGVLSIQLTEDNNTTRNAHASHCIARNANLTGFNFWFNSTLSISTKCYWMAIGY
ncbi:phage tail protein [Moraxella nasibovis]|uniref:phage tail-collar fiber domain-containing protein n=1 Tax=Moraxella nasibovis TaxID=2904120 RepID=UPI00240FE491|nr:phage tail protein [Moraxella nasibovis]WFF38032.1 phage tail protein [Moraxella nasibovis]